MGPQRALNPTQSLALHRPFEKDDDLERIIHNVPEGYRESQLENGAWLLTDMLDPINTRNATTEIMAWLRFWTGNSHDFENYYGLAHEVEHGSMEKSTLSRDKKQVLSFRRRNGIYFNAETNELSTKFYFKAPPENFFPALEMLFEMVLRAKIDPEEVRREKGVIKDEIRRYGADPTEYPDLVVASKIFGAKNPFALFGLGSEKSVERITVENIKEFRARYYTPENATLIVVGPYEYPGTRGQESLKSRADRFHQDIREVAHRNFKEVGPSIGMLPPREYSMKMTEPISKFIPRRLNEVFLSTGTHIGYTENSTDHIAAWLLAIMLNEKFYGRIREEMGQTYSAECLYTKFPENLLLLKTSCHPSKVQTVRDVIKELRDEFALRVDPKEFEDARAQLGWSVKASYGGGFPSIREHKNKRMGLPLTYRGLNSGIESVSPEDIVRAAQNIFSKPFAEVTLGSNYAV